MKSLVIPALIAIAGLAMFSIRTSPPLPEAPPSASVGSTAERKRFDDGLRTSAEAVCTRALATGGN